MSYFDFENISRSWKSVYNCELINHFTFLLYTKGNKYDIIVNIFIICNELDVILTDLPTHIILQARQYSRFFNRLVSQISKKNKPNNLKGRCFTKKHPYIESGQ